ncbi:efflux RND transporter periplasmic adaptor subunit [Flocculibacter collagenilyticus]|uniref:efflux RND transporter periplasmic adaptor subunit n=1 Tax=Flocculibacter collagenilyticus TaxID=2744479 RepID=UPI0018F27ED5|nr:HlyD family efflux transporter periplasmic adaptor subunit [Flocculibacter collagenilyticus]
MDVIKQKKKSVELWSKKTLLVSALVIGAMGAYLMLNEGGASASVQREQITLAKVQQGDIAIELSGYGKLKALKQKLLSAQREATVEEIILKPGAIVTPDSVIVQLSNPNLQQELLNAEQEYAQAVSQLRAVKLNQEKSLLVEQAVLEKLNASFESATLKLESQKELQARGIVSKFDLKQAVITEKEIRKQIAIQKNTIEKIKLMNTEELNIEDNKIEQFRIKHQSALDNVAALTVKAGMSGVLQELTVELGESLAIGKKIGIVGKTDSLIALLKIPQAQAEQIEIGQQAVIDTRKDLINGEVARIDPVVTEGTVSVEITLKGALPSSARPELNVDGKIMIDTFENVNYIKRPSNARASSDAYVYKVDQNNNQALLTKVEYGTESGNYIVIKQGLNENDLVIASDMSAYENKASLKIVN